MSDKIFSYRDWDALVEQAMDQIQTLARTKGGEYTDGEDRLSNFRRNGKDLGLCMEQVWGVYAGKHWDSIRTYIRDISHGVPRVRTEPIAGRVDDLLTYLLLFKAMLVEAGECQLPNSVMKPDPFKLSDAPVERFRVDNKGVIIPTPDKEPRR